jgi:hypothetical protein
MSVYIHRCPEITSNTLEVVSWTKNKMKLPYAEMLFSASVSSETFLNLRNVATSYFQQQYTYLTSKCQGHG